MEQVFALFATVFCLLSTVACSHGKNPDHGTDPAPPMDLQTKFDNYMAWSKQLQDTSTGWLPFSCDGLLFNSLYAVSGGTPDISLAERKPGKWERTPDNVAFGCSSDISKDMMRGLLQWMHDTKQLDAAERMIRYGVVHNWFMGEGPIGEVFMTPTLAADLYEVRFRLGGADSQDRFFPQDYPHGLKGFPAHLQVLGIFLRGQMTGAIPDEAKQILKEQAERVPRNGLFQAVYHRYLDGDQTVAINLLLDPKLFPNDHLPTTDERCSDYIYQRDDVEKDWGPCEGKKTHTGLDLIFAAHVVYAPMH